MPYRQYSSHVTAGHVQEVMIKIKHRPYLPDIKFLICRTKKYILTGQALTDEITAFQSEGKQKRTNRHTDGRPGRQTDRQTDDGQQESSLKFQVR